MPWVRIPVGPCLRNETGYLKWYPALVSLTTDAPSRVKRGWEGLIATCPHAGVAYDTVCTCDPGAHWTRSSWSRLLSSWLLCHVVNSSARVLMKDVPSCDKPRGPAWRVRTEDFRMGIPTAIASRNGERPELKHLSTDRKRNRMGCR